MNITIIYESFFGNTEQIARAMGAVSNKEIQILHCSEITPDQVSNTNFLIVGSPTRSFKPCEQTTKFLKSIPAKGLMGIKVAAFDTRISLKSIHSRPLRFIVKTGGYAAKHIAKSLVNKGGELMVQPEGFLVSDEKGPLVEGELNRARKWIENLLSGS